MDSLVKVGVLYGVKIWRERGNRRVAVQILQNGFGGSKKHTGLYLEITSGRAKRRGGDKKNCS